DRQAKKYSGVKMYSSYNRAAVKEMFRQVGDVVTDADGIAVRGLIVRHLVLPGGISGTEEIMKFLAEEVSKGVHISLMDQYFPAYKAETMTEISRKITPEEYQSAMDIMERYGLHEGWVQEHV
ncbi:MAG: radical SAM protein, partial [Nitrospirae bacterium]|nr:radical SAM protein [Nitrospirota bacterium]